MSWFTKRYPLTYSLIEMNYGGQTTEFSNVSGKNKLDIKQIDIGRSLLYNYPKSQDFTALDRKRITAALDRSYAADGWVETVSESTAARPAGTLFADAIAALPIDEAADLPEWEAEA